MSSGPNDGQRRGAYGAVPGGADAPAGDRSAAPDAPGNGESTDPDKRHEERAAIQLRVDYKRLNTFFADYTKNISKGGTFIRTARPLDVGTEFVFVLSVPSHGAQLALKGEVVWVVPDEEASSEGPAGMGIKFKFENDAEREEVDKVVEKLMDEALGHHISKRLLRRT